MRKLVQLFFNWENSGEWSRESQRIEQRISENGAENLREWKKREFVFLSYSQSFSEPFSAILLITFRINHSSCTRFSTHRINSRFIFSHLKWQTPNRRLELILDFHCGFFGSVPMRENKSIFNFFLKFFVAIYFISMFKRKKLMFCEHFFLHFKEHFLNLFSEIFKLHKFLFHRISPEKFYLSLL